MALGKRKRERQLEAFVSASDLPQSPGHPFYTALNPAPGRKRLRLRCRGSVRPVLRGSYGPSFDSAGRLLSDDVRGVLRGPAVAPQHRVAVCRQVTKRHLMKVAARNLSTIMRAICGIGSPRALQGLRAILQLAWTHFGRLMSALEHLLGRAIGDGNAAGQSTLAA